MFIWFNEKEGVREEEEQMLTELSDSSGGVEDQFIPRLLTNRRTKRANKNDQRKATKPSDEHSIRQRTTKAKPESLPSPKKRSSSPTSPIKTTFKHTSFIDTPLSDGEASLDEDLVIEKNFTLERPKETPNQSHESDHQLSSTPSSSHPSNSQIPSPPPHPPGASLNPRLLISKRRLCHVPITQEELIHLQCVVNKVSTWKGQRTHFQLYSDSTPLLHAKMRTSASFGSIPIDSGTEAHFSSTTHEGVLNMANAGELFSLRANSVTGEEILTLSNKRRYVWHSQIASGRLLPQMRLFSVERTNKLIRMFHKDDNTTLAIFHPSDDHLKYAIKAKEHLDHRIVFSVFISLFVNHVL